MPHFQNQYGHFTDDGMEYVITRPDTPMPWINVVSNGDYGFVLSQAGSGYSWRTHASLNRITRWEQDLVRDHWGRYLYLRDSERGDLWSVGWQPAGRALEAYQVRHGLGYSTLSARHGSIAHEITYFVPLDEPCELWLLTLRNEGERVRTLQCFSYFEWLLGAAPDWHREFHRLFIETNYDEAHGTLLATKALWDLPGQEGPGWNQAWPYVAFHSASHRPAGFDTDKHAFLGRHGHLSSPQAVAEGRSAGTVGRWGDAIGSLQLDQIVLPPGGQVEIVFSLGATDARDEALALAQKYQSVEAARAELGRVRRFWQEQISHLKIESPDPAVTLMARWLQYQAIAGRLWGRSAYYQTGGAFGFRDQLQDSLLWLLTGQPEKTLDQIRLHATHQYQEGIVLHWWHPLAEWGLRSQYSDDLLWLPFAVLYYLQETDDLDCLDEELPFFDGGSATLHEHCLRAFEVALSRRSERGLPLILEADWNDGMNAVGSEGRGESIWMAHFLHFLLRGWAALPRLDEATRERFSHEADALRNATNEHGWEGSWYWRASTDEGLRLGSAEDGRLFLNAQTWAVLSGLAPEARARQAMSSAGERLYKSYGPLLFSPAYSVPDPSIGYLSRYAPGARENGGVYVHAACWAVLAERQLNGVNAAYQLWRSFCPPLRGQSPDRYRAEPYVLPGNVHGPDSPDESVGGWTWYTGSAQWYLRALVEGVLGIVAQDGALQVRAALPDEWESFRIQRRHRGATYDIHVRRAAAGQPAGCYIDGEPWEEEGLPEVEVGSRVEVEYVIRPTDDP